MYPMTLLRVFPVLFLLSFPASAKLIKPEARCGPAIPRESVTVLDISELPEEAGREQVRTQLGEITPVRTQVVEAQTTVGRAWKRAEKLAAELGCPYVVVVRTWEETTGYKYNEWLKTDVPLKKERAEVWFARPGADSVRTTD